MHPRSTGAFGVSVVCILLPACTPAPVQWTAGSTVSASADTLALAADGRTARDSRASLALILVPPTPACRGSLRVAAQGPAMVAVWWAPRPDSSARLMMARTTDRGRTWGTATPVDTTDRSATGCTRAPPDIAADTGTGYVHVTYAMRAPEGPGLFFAHSMDGGATFHAPVPIVYGDRLGRTAVGASGDYVAVAFEDPNSAVPRVGLAISRTMGHIFEVRVLPVSDENGAADYPLVAISGRTVSVAWQERRATKGSALLRVRTGTLH